MAMFKRNILWILVVVFVVLIGNVGCTNPPANPPDNTGQNGNGGTSNNNGNTNNSGNPPAKTNEEQKELINNIVALAKQGKVINSDFAADGNVIDDVKKAWGNPDKEEYIADAKGTYCTYEKRGVVFAYNKGLRLFEVRSFDKRVKTIAIEDVKMVLGTPAHDKIIFGNQHIIGYKVNETYKLEFVFPKESADHPNPTLDHMNVLYPAGTVNSMKGDPGREW